MQQPSSSPKAGEDVQPSQAEEPIAGTSSSTGLFDQAQLASIMEKRSAEATLLAESFANPAVPFYEVCSYSTRAKCDAAIAVPTSQPACPFVHFTVRTFPQTDPSLGDCSYLNTCHHLDTCRYLHYEIEAPTAEAAEAMKAKREAVKASQERRDAAKQDGKAKENRLLPPQWLDCDLRKLDLTVLGTFDVIMADPPWDIQHPACFMRIVLNAKQALHDSMTLPYGTMTDDEMKAMPLGRLQKDGGLLFLWVTGRATELGRECLKVWGYKALDEIVWVKTNQIGRLIRTGRTGHWLNHSKEHCIVAYKAPATPSPSTSPPCIDSSLLWANRGVDTDVIVSEVRETSRKPDEIYKLIERVAPGKERRRLELFGRKHNTRDGWLTLGNQLGDSRVYEPEVVERLNQRYPQAPMQVSQLPKEYL